jgi:hypothetical protein
MSPMRIFDSGVELANRSAASKASIMGRALVFTIIDANYTG